MTEIVFGNLIDLLLDLHDLDPLRLARSRVYVKVRERDPAHV